MATVSDLFAGSLDLQLRMLLKNPELGKAVVGKALQKTGSGDFIHVLIKSSDTRTTSFEIEKAGGIAGSVIGDIMTAAIPLPYLDELAKRIEVEAVESSKEMRYFTDSARYNTGANDVQSGEADGTAYLGTNVVVGIIDSGLDYSRADFLKGDGDTRVQYLRFQSVRGSDIYVTECAMDTINAGNCTSAIPYSNDSTEGHGTHVTGIAAGNGGGTSYVGMAPSADIMMVRNTFTSDLDEDTGSFSSGVLDGVSEIFKKADIIDKPAVINISQGTEIGAHDNTSLLEQGINNAVAGQYATDGKNYGRIVVAAVGNEGLNDTALGALAGNAGGIHATVNVPSGSLYAYRLWALSTPARTPIVIDAWFGADDGGNCSIAAKTYDYDHFEVTNTANAGAGISAMPLSTDNDGETATTGDGFVTIIQAVDASDSQNNKPHSLTTFGPATGDSWSNIILSDSDGSGTINPGDTGYFLDVIISASGGACTGDMWIEGGGIVAHFTKDLDTLVEVSGTGSYTLQDGNNNFIVCIPATATGVIAVGSYLQPKPYTSSGSVWTDILGVVHDATDYAGEPADTGVAGGTVGQRSVFSSIGPTTDDRQKPELLAPGDPVISVLPTGYDPADAVTSDSTHYKSQGTSMAAPVVTGVIALLLEKNNTLTAEQMKSTLTSTANSSYTGYAAQGDGYGKLNASAAIDAIDSDTSGYDGTGDLTQEEVDGGDSTASSSACGSMLAPAGAHAPQAAVCVLLAFVTLALARRKMK